MCQVFPRSHSTNILTRRLGVPQVPVAAGEDPAVDRDQAKPPGPSPPLRQYRSEDVRQVRSAAVGESQSRGQPGYRAGGVDAETRSVMGNVYRGKASCWKVLFCNNHGLVSLSFRKGKCSQFVCIYFIFISIWVASSCSALDAKPGNLCIGFVQLRHTTKQRQHR